MEKYTSKPIDTLGREIERSLLISKMRLSVEERRLKSEQSHAAAEAALWERRGLSPRPYALLSLI
jgi:hypothetical protein